MLHTAAFFVNSTTDANLDVTALADGWLQIENGHFKPPYDLDLIACAPMGLAINRAQLITPRTRPFSPNFLIPSNPTATFVLDQKVVDFRDRPFRLIVSEEVETEMNVTSVGGEDFWNIITVRQRMTPAPAGEVWTIRMTATTAAVANTWTTLAGITNDFNLPAGNYAVVGGVHYSTGPVAFRLVPRGSPMKPGGISLPTVGDLPWSGQLNGGLGVWCTFNLNTLPGVEVLCLAADADHTIFLQVVKIG